ncbi:hypothetical protein HNP60_002636 [Sphingobium sp. B1D3A]|uniref:RHS repeat protein n=2 Tax=Sphingobium lignivorans TaxID=2735886 RepID=A0ABR6NJ74_9SPHN|nr:hypothetical protein [Sphingobium lignivorans]
MVATLFASSFLCVSSGFSAETQTFSYDALGRLASAQSSGTVNNGQVRSTCFDAAGNRTVYKSDSGGALANCSAGPVNQPPVANPDSTTIARCAIVSLNVTANDTDPEGHLPLAVQSVAGGSGLSLSIISASTIMVESLGSSGVKTFTYVIADSLGATATGNVTITVSNVNYCGV